MILIYPIVVAICNAQEIIRGKYAKPPITVYSNMANQNNTNFTM